MIPKSLTICVITGVLAAAILGVYLQQLNSKNIVSVQGPSVSGYVEKNSYKIGEIIPIHIVNTGTTKITFYGDSHGIIVRALDGTTFFATMLSEQLEPAQKYTFEWNQQKSDNSKILEGRYVIDIIAHDESGKRISDSFTLDLLK